MTPTLVQSATATGFNNGITVTLPAAPTNGNTLVMSVTTRGSAVNVSPAGWTALPEGAVMPFENGSQMWYKTASSDSGSYTWAPGSGIGEATAVIAEFSGTLTYNTSAELVSADPYTSTAVPGATVTPTAGAVALIVGEWGWKTDLSGLPPVAATGWTLIGSRQATITLNAMAYKVVAATSGSYTPELTMHANFTADSHSYGAQTVAFTVAPVPGMWFDFDRDGFDDATGTTGAPLVRMLPQGSGVSDEITSDVIRVQIDRVADVAGGSPIGTMTVLTKNTSGKYNPDNTASSVYGKINPGLPGWFGCNADGTLSGTGQTVYGRFGGYLRTVAPIAAPGATDAPTAEWVFDDAMARYREAKCRVAFSTSRTIATYRTAILSAIGETNTSLATEADTLAMSGSLGVRATSAPFTNYANSLPTNIAPLPYRPTTDTRPTVSALAVLEDLNRAVGTRHFIAPADTKEDFYRYTTRNRQYKLGAAADAALTGSAGVADTSGYVLSVDGVVNAMAVEARPFRINAQASTVWEYPNLPLSIDRRTTKRIVADFPDIVFEAVVSVTSTNSSVTATLASSGEGATITLSATTNDTVTALTVSGRQLIRLDPVLVEASDLASQEAYGERQGPNVSSDLITSEGMAEGIANYHIWASANPRKTPSVTIYNRLSTLLPLDLFDVVTLTVAQLDVTARRFEIVGIHETWQRAASASMVLVGFTLDLRETPNQSALSLLTFGTSLYGGTDGFAP